MNNKKPKQLYDSIQNMYERSQIVSSNPSNYFPIIAGELVSELLNNLILEDARKELMLISQEELAPLIKDKIITLQEIETTLELLDSYKNIIPELLHVLEECKYIKKIYPQNSHEIISELEPYIHFACFVIMNDRSKDHTKILARLVKLDSHGKIIEYIFAPTLSKWRHQLKVYKRNEKISVCWSWLYILKLNLFHDLKRFPNRIHTLLQDNYNSVAEQLHLDAQNFDQVLNEQNPERAAALGFDIKECEVHIHRVLEFFKPRLLSLINKKMIDCESIYNNATDKLIETNQKIKFEHFNLIKTQSYNYKKILSWMTLIGLLGIKLISIKKLQFNIMNTNINTNYVKKTKSSKVKNDFHTYTTINASKESQFH
jgi:hypothetical protein